MTPDQLRNQLEDNAVEVDEVAEDAAPSYAERVRQLWAEPAERNPDLWEDACDDAGIDRNWAAFSLDDLNAFLPAERDLTWQAASALVFACCERQAMLETTARALLQMAERHAAGLRKAPAAVVRAVAKTGMSRDSIKSKAEARRKGKEDVNTA